MPEVLDFHYSAQHRMGRGFQRQPWVLRVLALPVCWSAQLWYKYVYSFIPYCSGS